MNHSSITLANTESLNLAYNERFPLYCYENNLSAITNVYLDKDGLHNPFFFSLYTEEEQDIWQSPYIMKGIYALRKDSRERETGLCLLHSYCKIIDEVIHSIDIKEETFTLCGLVNKIPHFDTYRNDFIKYYNSQEFKKIKDIGIEAYIEEEFLRRDNLMDSIRKY